MTRSRTDKWIAGVFGGIGKSMGVSPLVLRILFVLIGHAFGIGIIAYLLLACFMPLEPEA